MLVVFCIVVAVVDFPGDTKFIHELQTNGYTIAFGLLALASLLCVRRTRLCKQNVSLLCYVAAFGFCMVVGVSIELIQAIMNRNADSRDVVRDITGIITFLGLCLMVDVNNVYSGFGEINRKLKIF